MTAKVLFLSNGHGEDTNANAIALALGQRQPSIQIGAMPIVGAGNSYRKSGIEIIGPTKSETPSGGFSYARTSLLLADIADGLLPRLMGQLAAIYRYSRDADLILAMGDDVVLSLALLADRPFFSFLCSTSAHYENQLRILTLRRMLLGSANCRRIYTRDRFTATCMQEQGFSQTFFVGNPFMDALVPSHHPLPTEGNLIALLPGSRLPEAATNLQILLKLVLALGPTGGHYWLALTPNFLQGTPAALAAALPPPWQVQGNRLVHPQVTVSFATDAFADILTRSTLVVGMAGTAIEQATGLGKPVVQIPGPGPQFTAAFADAQGRLLGPSIHTVDLESAPTLIDRLLQDLDYREQCRLAGQGRVGGPGAADQIAAEMLAFLAGQKSL